jgi:hypothetical protein
MFRLFNTTLFPCQVLFVSNVHARLKIKSISLKILNKIKLKIFLMWSKKEQKSTKRVDFRHGQVKLHPCSVLLIRGVPTLVSEKGNQLLN